MSLLKETIDQKLKQAMKGRDEVTVSTLRLLRAAIKNAEIEIRKALDDQGVIGLVKKMVKQAQESIVLFQKGNREDLVTKTEQEIAVLMPLLPSQLNPAELKKRVQEIIKQIGATSPQQMGEVMKFVSQKLAGCSDMKEASSIVREILSGK